VPGFFAIPIFVNIFPEVIDHSIITLAEIVQSHVGQLAVLENSILNGKRCDRLTTNSEDLVKGPVLRWVQRAHAFPLLCPQGRPV